MLFAPMTVVPPAPVKSTGPDPLASLPRQDRHKPKCGPVRPSKMGKRRMWVLIAVHVVVAVHIVWWLSTGSAITPVEPSEAMQTVELGRINAGFLLFVALIASTVIFGRWFCGWAWHVVALQDGSAWLLGKMGLKPRPVRSRLLVLAPWVVAFHMFAWPVVHEWLSRNVEWPWLWSLIDKRPAPLPRLAEWDWHLTTENLWQTFPGPLMGTLTFVVVGFLIVWWMGAKGFCTHGCPYGAFFAVADRFAPVRIKVTDACDGCGHCTSVCTSNVRVHEEVAKHKQLVDPGCMKCLDCVSVCPKDALYVGVALPKPFAISQQRIKPRADFTWPEEVLLAVTALVAAQWTFRGAWFWEGIPFLMAVGLGAITAVFALLLVRLLVRRDVTFQHTVLKSSGVRTRAGRWTMVGLAAWLLFSAHTFVVQRLQHGAVVAIEKAQEPLHDSFYEKRRVAASELEPALERIDAYRAWALIDEPRTVEIRALVLRGLGRHADAEQALLQALGGADALRIDEANLALARYDMDPRRRRFDRAERLIAHVLQHSPDHPLARMLQQALASLPR